MCTIVTAYYKIPSKFDTNKYMEWAKNFMKIECPIVLFTQPEYNDNFIEMRNGKKLKIINKPFFELETWKLYEDKFREHHKIDIEREYHSPELYSLWAEKSFFVVDAIKLNSFNTKYFMWLDIGCFRIPDHMHLFKEFPNISLFPENRVLFSCVEPLTNEDKIRRNDGIIGDFYFRNSLVGGLWGGSSEALIRWNKAYQNMLEKYFDKGRFAGKDQSVMISTLLENKELGKIVKCNFKGLDPWFYLEYLLSNLGLKMEFEESYL